MHYIIDGYNLIFNISNRSFGLEDNRKEILNNLKITFLDIESNLKIVFDGKGPDISFESFQLIQVIFTPEKMSADDYILEIVSTSLHPSRITVVSSDKSLNRQCKYLGANIMVIKEFLNWIKKRSSKRPEETALDFQDSKQNIERLNKIFEKRLKES